MKNIIDLMDIETSIVSLYEASLLDIDGTIEAGDNILKGAEEELKFIVKEISNPRNWNKYGICSYAWEIKDLKNIRLCLGNDVDVFEIFVSDIKDELVLSISFNNSKNINAKNKIRASIRFSKDKYIKKNKFGHITGLNISKIFKDYIAKPFSDVETLRTFLKNNATK